MKLEKLEHLNYALDVVVNHLENPLVDPHPIAEASASPETMQEISNLYRDFFRAENTDVLGDISVATGDGSGNYLVLSRTITISDNFVILVESIFETTFGDEYCSYAVDLHSNAVERQLLSDSMDSQNLFMKNVARISTDPSENGDQEQLEDSVDTMRRVHKIVFGTG